MNAGIHAHVAAFPYLDVSKISIQLPCLNFTIYSSHMLPHQLRWLDVLLLLISSSKETALNGTTLAWLLCKLSHAPTTRLLCQEVQHTCLPLPGKLQWD